MGKIKLIAFLLVGAFVLYSVLSGSKGSSTNVVNLDTVLDTMAATLTELDGESADTDAPAPTEDTADDPEKTNQVLGLYHTKINDAKMQATPIGIAMQTDGAILGFDDKDSDNAKGSGEKDLFKVEIDVENSRLVATDLEHGYARDHKMRFGGLLTGYFIGRMLTGQRGAGITSSKFKNTTMSKKGYHSAAKSSVAAKSRARSGGGSRSFSTGK